MAGKSGTARLARLAGVPVTPVGLWGTHRIMMKGRKPHWQWGLAQTAVIGKPVTVGADEHIKDATEQIMQGIRTCVARAREIYPQLPAPGDDAWWVRSPESVARADAAAAAAAVARRRPVKVTVIGAGSWGTAVAGLVAANAPTTLWARRRGARRANRRRARERRLPPRRRAAAGAPGYRRSRGGMHRRRRDRVRSAVARLPHRGGAGSALHRAGRAA